MTDPTPADEALTALGTEVEALRLAMDSLAAVPGQIADLAGAVAALGEKVAAAAPPARAGLPSWLVLDGDFADTVAVLGELVEWMRLVFFRYSDARLPECWLWHPDVVEELLWLRGAWIEAYAAEAGSVAKAGDWHDRARPGVIRRIRAVAGTCSLEAHQAGRSLRSAATPVVLAEAIHDIGEWWATDREAAPPDPTAAHFAAAKAWRGR